MIPLSIRRGACDAHYIFNNPGVEAFTVLLGLLGPLGSGFRILGVLGGKGLLGFRGFRGFPSFTCTVQRLRVLSRFRWEASMV